MSTDVSSKLLSQLKDKKFTFTGELEPEKTTSLFHVIEAARKLENHVVACNVTDNPQSFAYVSSLAASYIVQKETGMEAICQMTCRDRNRIALFSDLLGAAALGIRDILALTGDHTTLGDTPQAKPVFDLDAVQLVHMIRKAVDKGLDMNDKPIEHAPRFAVGAGANPNTTPLEPELLKFEKKVLAGVDFFQTQVVFNIETATRFLEETKRYGVPVLVGIFPLKSYAVAKYFDETVPGVKIPPPLLEALAKAKAIDDKTQKRARYDEINLDYFTDFIRELRKSTSAAGCHITSVDYEEIIPPLVNASE